MLILCLGLIAALILEDQLIKLYIVNNIRECTGFIDRYYTFRIGNFDIFSITHIRNDGAGFSILEGKTAFLLVFTFIVMAGITAYICWKRKSLHRIEMLCLSMIVAGGIGNFIDRVRMVIEPGFNGVIDYIKLEFISFPIFNFADMCVCVGAFGYCIYVIIAEIKQQKLKNAQKAAEAEATAEAADNTEPQDEQI